MLDIISDRIIRWGILNGKLDFNDYDEIDFKIKSYIQEFLIGLIIFLLGILVNCVIQIIIISIIFNLIKTNSFKYHFGTFYKCLTITTSYMILLSLISKYTVNYRLYTFFICIVLFIFTLKNVPNIPDEDKTKSDKFYLITYISIFIGLVIIDLISMNIVNKYTFLVSNSVSIGIISVELFLTRIGFKCFKLIDRI